MSLLLLAPFLMVALSLLASPAPAAKPVGYADRDPVTGISSLKVNGYLLQQLGKPVTLSAVGLWSYDVDKKIWRRVVTFPAGLSVTLQPEKRQVYSRKTDRELIRLTDQVGLFWTKWKEDGQEMDAFVYAGPVLCNDIALGAPPKGMVATCVPLADQATAMFVPDPKVYCRD